MEDYQLGSVATGSGGLGTDDTTSINVVEPSPFVAAGDRFLLHLNSSFSTACRGVTQTAIKMLFLVEQPEQGERDTQKRELKLRSRRATRCLAICG